MSIGSGIAIAGIWVAVAACAYAIGPGALLVAGFATFATLFVAVAAS